MHWEIFCQNHALPARLMVAKGGFSDVGTFSVSAIHGNLPAPRHAAVFRVTGFLCVLNCVLQKTSQ